MNGDGGWGGDLVKSQYILQSFLTPIFSAYLKGSLKDSFFMTTQTKKVK